MLSDEIEDWNSFSEMKVSVTSKKKNVGLCKFNEKLLIAILSHKRNALI